MSKKQPDRKTENQKNSFAREMPGSHQMFEVADDALILDTEQLDNLEKSFRTWALQAKRKDVRISRKRILAIYLLARYTGARLGEILDLDAHRQINLEERRVILGKGDTREVPVSERLCEDIEDVLTDMDLTAGPGNVFNVDPGHVRRKFYERARACGFPPESASPAAIRRARALELIRSNMPVPVAQRILGQSTPSLTISHMSFPDPEISHLARKFFDRESRRKTSARNIFYGTVNRVLKGDIQSIIVMDTYSGSVITTVITNNSVERLGIQQGNFITAEIKAPWVVINCDKKRPGSSASNIFHGTVERIVRGKIVSEILVCLDDKTRICSVITDNSLRTLNLETGTQVWIMFNSFAVILHSD